MARVRLNETQDLPEDHRWLFERMEKRGSILNIFRSLSHSPVALRRFMKFGSYFLEEGKLDPKLRELAILAPDTCAARRTSSRSTCRGADARASPTPDSRRRQPERRAVRPARDGRACRMPAS